MMLERADELLALLLDESADAAALEEITLLIEADPQFAVRVRQHLLIDDLASQAHAAHRNGPAFCAAFLTRLEAEEGGAGFAEAVAAQIRSDELRPTEQAEPGTATDEGQRLPNRARAARRPSHRLRRARSGRGALTWVAVAATVLVAVGLSLRGERTSPSPVEPTTIAVIVAAEGDVTVAFDDGPASPATVGMSIRSGQTVRAGADARFSVLYGTEDAPEVTTLDARGNAVVLLFAEQGAKRVRLERGSIACSVAAQPPGKAMRLLTPHATAVVVGTRFSLAVADSSTRLDVDEGAVRLERASDGAAVEVTAGHWAVAATDVELAVKPVEPVLATVRPPAPPIPPVPTSPPMAPAPPAPPAKSVLMLHDFENGQTGRDWIGSTVAGPAKPGSSFCIEGRFLKRDNRTRVRLGDNKHGIFTYRDGAVLAFDYWVDERVKFIIVYAWDRNQQASFGNHSPFTPKTNEWTHAVVPLAEFSAKDARRLRDGNLIVDLTIQTGEGTGTLFVDDVEISVPAPSPSRRAPMRPDSPGPE